ncbi:MAG TPA: hypothetical protein VFA90_18795 [Terriglobales bacterium]|nr:hypothetical protein [Terriglobales bacterium]
MSHVDRKVHGVPSTVPEDLRSKPTGFAQDDRIGRSGGTAEAVP